MDEMSHQRIEEEHIAELYLGGRLPPDLAERFEEHYLACEECLERLELGRRFDRALRGVVAEEAARAGFFARLGIVAAWRRLSRFAQAGVTTMLAVLLLVPVGMLVAERGRAGAERDRWASERQRALSPQANTAPLRLSPERSPAGLGEPSARITLGGEPEWFMLSLAVDDLTAESFGARRYRATLYGPLGEAVWENDTLEREAAGPVTIGLHSSFLAPGDYRLRLTGLDPAGREVALGSFTFRVIG